MNGKKCIKVSISAFFLITVIIVMILYIIKLKSDKKIEIQKSNELQTQVNILNGTVTDLQGKINTISEIIKTDDIKENVEIKNYASKFYTDTTISFDGSKAVNSNEKDYTLSCQGNAGIWVTVDSTQQNLTFNFSPTKVVEFYSLNWKNNKNDMINSTITFDKKIIDVFFGAMGQDSSNDTLFILLEDSTVEYIPIVHMFNHSQTEVKSYGKINGVNDVIKFTLSSTADGVTTLGIKNNGTFYDLWCSLKDTGNY